MKLFATIGAAAVVLATSTLPATAHGATDAGSTETQATSIAKAVPEEGQPSATEAGHEGASGPHAAELPRDTANEDPGLPIGTIAVHAVDARGAPLPSAEVTLGILHNTVAQGESRKRVVAQANAEGVATFENLEHGSGIAYRAMLLRDGATFSAPPFQLSAKNGVRAVVHAYPVERELPPFVVSQVFLYAELKEDLVQIQQILKIYNFSPVAWVPNDVVLPLPPAFKAFTAQQGMTDVGLDAVDKKGLRLRGTFTPGEHEISYRWQLPYAGGERFSFEVGLPAHLAAVRVMAPSSRNMQLEVDGFPKAENATDGMGQRALMTERQLTREDPALTTLKVALTGLPTEGPGKIIATVLAALGVAAGIAFGLRKPKAPSPEKERERLLDDLRALQLAHEKGEIGPKTYERARRECIDELARTLAAEAQRTKAKKKTSARTSTAPTAS